jgi:transcriptional regulator with XRE-family HTH domain
MEILKKIGQRLKKIRVQHNLTQKKMSREVGLSVSTISLIEQGKSTTVESLIRILIRLNRIKDFESVFRVGENLELKLKFEKAKLKSERKRASNKIK